MLTKWIISRIPNHEDVKNERVRSAYGKGGEPGGHRLQRAAVCGQAGRRSAQQLGRDHGRRGEQPVGCIQQPDQPAGLQAADRPADAGASLRATGVLNTSPA